MANLSSPAWGNVSRFLLSDYGEQMDSGICNLYEYCASYCMQWSPAVCFHPGFDVTMDYGTTVYAPAAGTITCAGTGVGEGYDGAGCAAYPDLGPDSVGPAIGVGQGHGRVELLLDDGTVIIYGHCSQALAPLGSRVEPGDPVAASGAMNSPHLHYEVRVANGNCTTGYAIVDPRTVPCAVDGCGGADREPIQPLPGDIIKVVDPEGLNLRTEPTLAGGANTIITTLPNGTKLEVIEKAAEADNLHFYKVKVASGGGWGWRAIGPTTNAVWVSELRNISPSGSPMLPEAAACNAAAGEHSALALAMAWVEQKYGTYQVIIPESAHNPMSLRASGGGWQQFPTYAAGIAAWYRLLTDPDGPYANTKTVADLIHVYAPDSDPSLPPGASQEAQYVADIERLIERYRKLEGTTQADVAAAETGYVAVDYCRFVNRFQVGDQIRVVDGPLNIRPQASTDGLPSGMYQTGTELCVLEGPTLGESYEWYRVDGTGQDGWIAGNFCGIVKRGGCATADVGGQG
jgi:hypothetical protein